MYYLTARSVDNIISVIYILLTTSKIHIQGISCTVWTELKWTTWTSTADFCDQWWTSGFHNSDQQPSSTQRHQQLNSPKWDLVSSMVSRHFVQSLALLLWFLIPTFAKSSVTQSNHRSFDRLWPQDSNGCHLRTAALPIFWHAQAMGNLCHDSYTQFHKNSVSFVILPHPSSSTHSSKVSLQKI